MSDQVGNPEDRFSHNEAHIGVVPTIWQEFILKVVVFFSYLIKALDKSSIHGITQETKTSLTFLKIIM